MSDQAASIERGPFSTEKNEANLERTLHRLKVQQPNTDGQYPVIYHLDVTGRCNLSCLYCQRDFFVKTKHPFLKGDLPDAVFQRLLPYLPHAKLVALLSMLGEPLVVKELPRWWTLVAEAGAKPQTTTNGTFLTEKIADVFTATGGRLKISIDTLRQPTLSLLRPKMESSLLVDRLELVERQRRAHTHDRFQLGVNTVATAANLPHIVETWEECLRHARVDIFTMASFRMPRDERGMYHRDAERLSVDTTSNEAKASWRAILEWSQKRRQSDGIEFVFPYSRREWANLLGEDLGEGAAFDDRDDSARADVPYHCCVPWLKVGVLSDGTVIPCHLLYWPAPEVSFGSLLESDFDSIWNGEAYREFRSNMAARTKLGPCADCKSWWRYYSPQRID